jgi:hypothetical protein
LAGFLWIYSGILEKVFSIGDAELAGEEFGEEGVTKVY